MSVHSIAARTRKQGSAEQRGTFLHHIGQQQDERGYIIQQKNSGTVTTRWAVWDCGGGLGLADISLWTLDNLMLVSFLMGRTGVGAGRGNIGGNNEAGDVNLLCPEVNMNN